MGAGVSQLSQLSSLPITTAPGQAPHELLALSDIFQHISFPQKEKNAWLRGADGKGQA